MGMKGRWGSKENEEFLIGPNPPAKPLTNSFDDNWKIANVRQSDTFVLYVNYERGTEEAIEIIFGYSCLADDPIAEEFYEESVVDNDTGQVDLFLHRITATGKYRLGLPLALREDRVKVLVRGSGVSLSGKVSLYFSTNNPRSQQSTGFRT